MTKLLHSELRNVPDGRYATDFAYRNTHPNAYSKINLKPGDEDGPIYNDDGDIGFHKEMFMYDEGSTVVPDEATGIAPAANERDRNHDYELNGLRIVNGGFREAVDAETDKRDADHLENDEFSDLDDAAVWLRQNDPGDSDFEGDKKAA